MATVLGAARGMFFQEICQGDKENIPEANMLLKWQVTSFLNLLISWLVTEDTSVDSLGLVENVAARTN